MDDVLAIIPYRTIKEKIFAIIILNWIGADWFSSSITMIRKEIIGRFIENFSGLSMMVGDTQINHYPYNKNVEIKEGIPVKRQKYYPRYPLAHRQIGDISKAKGVMIGALHYLIRNTSPMRLLKRSLETTLYEFGKLREYPRSVMKKAIA